MATRNLVINDPVGIKQGDTVVINVEGTDADACADKLIGILANAA